MINQTGFKFGWKKIAVKPTAMSGGFYAMREWQGEAFDLLKMARYMILNAPMGSGKSWLMCLLSAYKMKQDDKLRCIIAVPQTIIANGFAEANLLMPDGEKLPWIAQHNLCSEQPNEGTIAYVIKWLEGPYGFFGDRVLLCSHATLVAVYKRLKETNQRELLNNLLLWVDEAHHLKNASIEGFENAVVSNGIGELVTYAQNQPSIQVGLATASFFRGDRLSLLTEEMEKKFSRYNLPYDKYLASMEHLQSFSFDFLLCGPDYPKAIEKLIKSRKGKDIIYIPPVNSRHSTGDKYEEVYSIIDKYHKVYGGKIVDTADGLTSLIRKDSSFKICDLVDERRRSEKKDYIGAIKDKDDLDAIIALGMFKEGANWIWADRSIVVAPRDSLTDVIQMVGRLFRDAEGKKHVEVIQLLPFSLDQQNEGEFKSNLNNYLKAIYASLILENVLHPVTISIKSDKTSKITNEDVNSKRDFLGESVLDEASRLSLIEDVSKELLRIMAIADDNIDSLWDAYQIAVPEILAQYDVHDNQEEIGKQIWAMFARQSIRMTGIDVDEIDFDILKKTSPLDFMIRYTSDNCGIDTFAKLRTAIMVRDPELKKKQLLEMARSGAPRPNCNKHPLGQVLGYYTNPNSQTYDKEFSEEIRLLRPDWFVNTADKKKQLLEMAKNGEPKPERRKHELKNSFYLYTNPKKNTYDHKFTNEIKEIRPDWFVTQSDIANNKKKQLLEMAKNGEPKPIPNKHPLGHMIHAYTRVSHESFDPEFANKIKRIRPDWFVTPSEGARKNKKQLLEMARNGSPKPIYDKHPLGERFGEYVNENKSSFDPEFTKEIKKLRPEWFISKSDIAKEKKKQLLEMAKNGDSKPIPDKHPLGQVLGCYTNPNSQTYDKEFSEEIRLLRSDWFVNTASENKKQLLEMAKNGEPKPVYKKHPLGQVFGCYANSNRRSFDPEFFKEIKKVRPDWLIGKSDIIDEKKKQLLEMAKNGEPRPVYKKHPLATSLFHYTNPNSQTYDPEFDKKIRRLAPDWFVNTANEKKKQLLEMAKNGEPRPVYKKHPLGQVLGFYTNPGSCYDLEFDKEIRKVAPNWFVTQSDIASDKKKRLLEIARNKEPRPNQKKHLLGMSFCTYTNPKSNCYDPEFDKEIRKLCPEWFKR
jgi:hypothetical protein